MAFFNKNNDSPIILNAWRYARQSDRSAIKQQLCLEQFGFCAYTEEYLSRSNCPEIEHFDPSIKEKNLSDPTNDSYQNWFSVCRWVNAINQKGSNPLPNSLNLAQNRFSFCEMGQTISYFENGQYVSTHPEFGADLTEFIRLNDPEHINNVLEHLDFIDDQLELLGWDKLKTCMFDNPKKYLNYIRAIESEFGVALLEDWKIVYINNQYLNQHSDLEQAQP